MAVYTPVSFADASTLFARAGLGTLTALEGIAAGIENTNYFATSDRGRYVLTLFERLDSDELPYYLNWMRHLARHGLPVPAPQPRADGELALVVAGKPAAIVTRLAGVSRPAPTRCHVEQVGRFLAQLHAAGASFEQHQPHPRGLAWCERAAAEVAAQLPRRLAVQVAEELTFQHEVAASAAALALPRGPIHADLFRDNVLFDAGTGEDRLSGVFDFYFGGDEALLFDIAVCLNDWCTDAASGALDEARAEAFVAAYRGVRELDHAELRLMPAALRAAALRFWISRLHDAHLPRTASLLQAKDPAQYERILTRRREEPWHPAP